MIQLNSTKEIFTYIRDEVGFLEDQEYLCLAINILMIQNKITKPEHQKASDFLNSNRPNNDDDDFSNSIYWVGGFSFSWWNVGGAIEDGFYPAIISEKRRFLTHLIYLL
jgi:hypothetical protein